MTAKSDERIRKAYRDMKDRIPVDKLPATCCGRMPSFYKDWPPSCVCFRCGKHYVKEVKRESRG